MSYALLAACMWVVLATFVAFLPMRRQFAPGIVLLIGAPVILIWIGVTHGVFFALAGLAGFLSMFRKPLRYYVLKAMGRAPELPQELRELRGEERT
ncbi:DUF2484 family protein [Rhodalgimonas zhirmunskyi]|uniref:DUF2484 family protein n=1 Tax=Rhodalgimonas zhirmunskyi TaxID=2964767 RepID=A0AAJ1U8U7_9RHOB|nr:DUF2484 family protein [Rhodoalgimonas zhirmunskyi]MDQ2095461.1 DUF2484 family protein [Rhodoalgimonas zhirmunskyi]